MATKLHFTADVLEEQMYADFGNLNKFDIEAFKELSIIVFTFLTDPKQVRLCQQMQNRARVSDSYKILIECLCLLSVVHVRI